MTAMLWRHNIHSLTLVVFTRRKTTTRIIAASHQRGCGRSDSGVAGVQRRQLRAVLLGAVIRPAARVTTSLASRSTEQHRQKPRATSM